MHLTFGDMTKEVNIFQLGKQPRDLDDQSFKMNLIEGLTKEQTRRLNMSLTENLIWSLMTSILTKSSNP